MKRILTILSVLVAAMALVSCNKDGELITSYYAYDDILKHLDGSDVQEIDKAWKDKENAIFLDWTDAQAEAEWMRCISQIDNSKVNIIRDDAEYTLSLVKYNVYDTGGVEAETKAVKTIGTRTWTKAGVK